MRPLARQVLLVLAVINVATALFAQRDADRAKGVAPDQTYGLGQLDTINYFNGNVNLAIPIGQKFTVGGSLSYQFVLSYSGNDWRYVETSINGPDQVFILHAAVPIDQSNAGFGWTLSLGKLLVGGGLDQSRQDGGHSIWSFIAPDGSEH